ncbi:putative leucine-rich repeat-containing, plant-type, leucine-rich repeat domain superfamily [Helianthus annuus]|uniref:Leucine-rich repeat-containing, plant-type, leucine-rich repeat domain superfamily n=1 Tax=Helianthus annuus TaxID=4232 RepID=A0A251THN2_HELAN|nr:putative leucine-rich repeat-containing, plant-type, leucine-rich repeat domain superfamily [Helianthus annuus]KAJ0513269.1 putative leucine-rich repeat-containing, plant-type, leucine-rich repeat domain superfamily [Helianthus annuus]KAJ0521045.1 putative leucine-rich repeat-containing, plant-type, leucine-rich repeat domain superfamily [Helianthus annuus]KAJ0529383.1 putative leucine-rich repeat-containing, plant-type, leucine-rich repeat domain superfamily [Helianthus annuus]KAJ0696270.1 
MTEFLVTNTSSSLAANITKACMDHELQSLYLFKNSVFDPSGMLATWTGTSCCLWERVWCDGITENVKSLYLRGHISSRYEFLVINDVGTSYVALKELQYLDLSWNHFQGSLISQFIGSLKQLQHLNLSTASLSGVVPDFIGNLSNLKQLDLSYIFFWWPTSSLFLKPVISTIDGSFRF